MRPSPLLVACLIVIALAGCATTTETATTPTPTMSAAPTPSPTPDEPEFVEIDASLFYANELELNAGDWPTLDVNFASTDHNLGCAILGEEHGFLWGCVIDEKSWEFPNASPEDFCYDAQVSCGRGIEAEGEEIPHPRYRGDPGFPAAFALATPESPIRVLAVGESVTFANVTCYSEVEAIRCVNNASGHGFVISADLNEIF